LENTKYAAVADQHEINERAGTTQINVCDKKTEAHITIAGENV
jgi:hypothetical protein